MKHLIITTSIALFASTAFAQMITGETIVCPGVYNVYKVDGLSEKITWTVTNGNIQETIAQGASIHARFTADGNVTATVWFKKENVPGYNKIAYTLTVAVKKTGVLQSPTVQQCPTPISRTASFKIKNSAWQITPYGTSNWSTISTTTTNSISINIPQRSNFRIVSSDCPTLVSNIITVDVMPKPVVIPSDKEIFSGGLFVIPSANIAGSTLSVTATAKGVTGSYNTNGVTGTLPPQALSSTSGGSVTYSVTPSKNGCVGDTKRSIVTVYRTPAVSSTGNSVYKNRTATLSTDVYSSASYEWRNASEQVVGTSSSFKASVKGKYKVVITKGAARGISDWINLSGQLDGVNENYIVTRQPLKKFPSTTGLENKLEGEVAETIQYLDGYGRPVQNIDVRNSSQGHRDVVQSISYDRFGRETIKYLPYVSSEDNGRFQDKATSSAQESFYLRDSETIVSDANPFSKTVYENSPLDRVVQVYPPGAAWQKGTTHSTRKEYLSNKGNEVLLLGYSAEAGLSVRYYGPATLSCVRTIDEEQNDVLEYLDREGRTVCKKVKAPGNVYACTYYVFDDFGRLALIVPPEAVERILKANN